MDRTIILLENGAVLDPGALEAPTLTEYAREKGLGDARVFVTSFDTYLLTLGEEPVFESKSYEAVAVHIDIISLSEED